MCKSVQFGAFWRHQVIKSEIDAFFRPTFKSGTEFTVPCLISHFKDLSKILRIVTLLI